MQKGKNLDVQYWSETGKGELSSDFLTLDKVSACTLL